MLIKNLNTCTKKKRKPRFLQTCGKRRFCRSSLLIQPHTLGVFPPSNVHNFLWRSELVRWTYMPPNNIFGACCPHLPYMCFQSTPSPSVNILGVHRGLMFSLPNFGNKIFCSQGFRCFPTEGGGWTGNTCTVISPD